ncbi:helix-hairpin-helix domain-containing protein [Crocinitomicaceae bacterium]|nr:helix-hairpin-helix domain-containing protein [Crocinitomicaceae bacterium]
MAILLIPRVLFYFRDASKPIINSEQVERFETKKSFIEKKEAKKKSLAKKYFAPSCRFNPNEYLLKDWMALGLSQKQSESVINFIKRGIHSNKDLEKIYVLPEEVFSLIKDSTFYPQEEKTENKKYKVDSIFKVELLDINLASKEDLIQLKGIGEFYAKQIIKYREELGGFIFIEQLLEVWKMRLETYQMVIPQIKLNRLNIEKININTCTIDDLKKHPYLDYYQANSLVKMRAQREKFSKLIEILDSKLINEEEFERISPYLSL